MLSLINVMTLPQCETPILCYTSQREAFVKVLRAVRIVMSLSDTIRSKAGEVLGRLLVEIDPLKDNSSYQPPPLLQALRPCTWQHCPLPIF